PVRPGNPQVMALRRPVRVSLLALLMAFSSHHPSAADVGAGPDDAKARRFVDDHVRRVRPLEHAAALAWWNANVSGKDEDFREKEEAQNRLDAALSDPGRFAELKAL